MVQIKSLGNFVPPTPRQSLNAAATSHTSASLAASKPKPSTTSTKAKGKQKAAIPSSSVSPLTEAETSLLEFLTSFSSSTLSSPTFNTQLQDLKGLLYHKKYEEAFSTSGEVGEERRNVYAARWVPSRALIYSRIFDDLKGPLRKVFAGEERKEIVCLGGGAGSEVAGIASWWAEHHADREGVQGVKITCFDMGDWDHLLSRMEKEMTSHWTSLEGKMSVNFTMKDVLDPVDRSSLSLSSEISPPVPQPYSNASLLTLFFTLSELFLQSLPATLSFLQSLNLLCKTGCILLVVESASLSTIPLGKQGRIYSIKTVLDHALIPKDEGRKGSEHDGWELVFGDEEGEGEGEGTKWYRMPEAAQDVYDEGKGRVKLEGSRVFIRAYRKR